MPEDPFSILGIPRNSSTEDIRNAWREKIRLSHPDVGGSHELSISLNQALQQALASVQSEPRNHSESRGRTESRGHTETVVDTAVPKKFLRDSSSFTIDVLPVECWHVLEIVAAQSGSILADEPPYLIEFTLHDSGIDGSVDSWCRCEMVPEAGGTTVHITVGSTQLSVLQIDIVRDYLVRSLNDLDWND